MSLVEEDSVREHALVAGDVDRAIESFSPELRQNLGEVLALLPLPASEAALESVERGGAGYNVVLRLAGEVDEVLIQTRWKDRDGRPTIVEASHLSRTALPAPDGAADENGETERAG
jgi:hypothetical protein